MVLSQKSETERRKKKRHSSVTVPTGVVDNVEKLAKQLRPVIGHILLSLSEDDLEIYLQRQKTIQRVMTLREYDDLEKFKIRCSYLGSDTVFFASARNSSYAAEIEALAEACPVLEMCLEKYKAWGLRAGSVVFSDSKSAVARIISKSVISAQDADVFKPLAKLKDMYMKSEWEIGSCTDRVNPGDSFTKISSGFKMDELLEVLQGTFNVPLGQLFMYKRVYTWERPLCPSTKEI
ncbi:unnamed protein product [Amoebophrya sp. A120]|nr:unnamed protein product [Amoebophrya sp. A120]|eukprot:GSA120T00012124001.1